MDTFPEGCGYRVAIVRMNQLECTASEALTQREAEHALGGGIGVKHPPLRVEDGDEVT